MQNDELIRFRVPAPLKQQAERYASSQQVSVGALLRELLRGHLVNQPLPVPPKPRRPRTLKLTDGTKLKARS